MSVTGGEAPWITPPVTCPCDDVTTTPMTPEAWLVRAETGEDLLIGFRCPDDTAAFQRILPLPKNVVVDAIRVVSGEPICQTEGFVSYITEEELLVCRRDVIDYAIAFMTINPGVDIADTCSPTLP